MSMLLKPSEVAAELKIDVRSVYRLMRTGELPCVNLGHRTKRITRIALRTYLSTKVEKT